MFKRQDSDIFGTRDAPVAHRIINDTPTDPNATFKNKMESQYNAYKQKVQKNQFRHTITQIGPVTTSQVMEKAQFDQDYHHNRKDMDMQSSIFYPPSHISSSRVSQNFTQNSVKPDSQEYFKQDFRRKETLSREYKNIPQNSEQIRGNSSRLFGFDDRVDQKQHSIPIMPLIPHYMKWDEYDSVRYQGNAKKTEEQKKQSPFGGSYLNSQISVSVSTVFEGEQKNKPKQNPETQPMNPKAFMKKQKQPQMKQNRQKQSNSSAGIEIKILNGWHPKHLQGLSKQCKLNGTNLIKLQITQPGKGTIVLQKSKRWESVTDWLRKDAKLKLRVMNT